MMIKLGVIVQMLPAVAFLSLFFSIVFGPGIILPLTIYLLYHLSGQFLKHSFALMANLLRITMTMLRQLRKRMMHEDSYMMRFWRCLIRMKDRIIALFYRLLSICKSVCSRKKGQISIQPKEENVKLSREMRRKLRA